MYSSQKESFAPVSSLQKAVSFTEIHKNSCTLFSDDVM